MAFGTNNCQTAGIFHFLRELDVGTTTRHIGSNGNGTEPIGRASGFGNNLRFLQMLLGIQHLVRNFAHAEHLAEQLTDFHRGCTDQARASAVAHFLYLIDYGSILFTSRFIDTVFHILTLDRTVGRDFDNIELVDVPKFACLGRSSTRHTRQLVVHTEVVLQCNSGKSLCSSFHLYVFLGFHSLV